MNSHSCTRQAISDELKSQESDSFRMAARRPEPGQDKLVPQEDELEAATWMPLEEYAAIPFHKERPLLRQIMECCMAYAKGTYKGMQGVKLNNGHSDPWPSREDLLVFGKDLTPPTAML